MRILIKNGYGIVMHDDPEEELNSLDESFPCINQDKYIGINVLQEFYGGQDVLQIVHYNEFFTAFMSWRAILEVEYVEDNDGADWYKPYEELIVHIVEELLPNNEVCWCMDLARKVESELQDIHQKEYEEYSSSIKDKEDNIPKGDN